MVARKIKIYFFIDSFRIGGMHRQVLYLVKHLNREIFEPIVCTQSQLGGLSDAFISTGCRLVDLKWKGRGSIAILRRFIRALNQDKPDIIYITQAPNLIYFLLARPFLNKSVLQLGSFRAMDFWMGHANAKLKYFDTLLAKLLYHTSSQIVVNSVALKDHYSKFINVKEDKSFKVIYNGSDFNFPVLNPSDEIRKELSISNEDVVIVMVARLDPAKDFETFLEAARDVISTHKNAKFLIVGDGGLRDYIEKAIEKFKIESNFLMIGEKKNVFDFINLADISVLSTFGEGFSNTILESMSFGKPVIASNVGGNPELLEKDKKYGILVSPRSVNELSEAIIFLINNKQVRNDMGSVAKERIHQLCSIERYISCYEELFSSLVLKQKQQSSILTEV